MSSHYCPSAKTSHVGTGTSTQCNEFTTEKKLLKVAPAATCVLDMRPSYIMKDSIFSNSTETVLSIIVKSNVCMYVISVPPDSTNIIQMMQILSSTGQEALTDALEHHLAERMRIGSTINISIDRTDKICFLVASAHLIDNEFAFHHRTLTYSQFHGLCHAFDVLDSTEALYRSLRSKSMMTSRLLLTVAPM